MKKSFLLACVILSTLLSSCSTNDDASVNDSPQIANIKLEVITSRNSDAIINRTINNNTETDEIDNLPYNFTYAQQEVSQGTLVKLSFLDNGLYFTNNSGSNWTDYTAELKISVNNEVVKSQNFSIVETSGMVLIEYTF